MNDLFDPTVCVRFTFLPDRAHEFIEEPGQTVSQIECESIEEVMEFVSTFSDALLDASAIVPSYDEHKNKIIAKVVSLSDYAEEE